MVQNFMLIYLEMGLQRMADPKEVFAVCVPNLLKGISSKPVNQQESLFYLLLRVDPYYSFINYFGKI